MKKTKRIKSGGWLRGTPRNPSRPIKPQYQFILISIVFTKTNSYKPALTKVFIDAFLRFRDLKFFDFALLAPSLPSLA